MTTIESDDDDDNEYLACRDAFEEWFLQYREEMKKQGLLLDYCYNEAIRAGFEAAWNKRAEWCGQPIQTAPKKGEVFLKMLDGKTHIVAEYDNGKWLTLDGLSYEEAAFIEWMPIPKTKD